MPQRAVRYWQLAAQARVEAAQMTDEESRRAMMEIAERHERLAQHLKKRDVSGSDEER